VLQAIDGVDGFIVAQRDWGTVVNYVQMGPDMFPEVHTAGGSASMRELHFYLIPYQPFKIDKIVINAIIHLLKEESYERPTL
jgi:hypothetical protein